MLFDKQTYMNRRTVLRERVKHGLILFFGNNDSPMNYPANVYKFRQDSSFLYYFGQHREGLQMSFFQLDDPVLCQIRDQLLSIDVNNLTPIEALNKLNDIKKILKGK